MKHQELRFSRQLLAATMENVDSGISVVDADMNLVAWNSPLSRALRLSKRLGIRRPSVPILIRWNAQRGEFRLAIPSSRWQSGLRTCAPARHTAISVNAEMVRFSASTASRWPAGV